MATINDIKNVLLNLKYCPSKRYVANKLSKSGVKAYIDGSQCFAEYDKGVVEIHINRKHTVAWLSEIAL